MKSGKRRLIWILLAGILAGLIGWGPAPVLAEPDPGEKEDLRQIQDQILQWKREENGKEFLLSGALLDQAGSSAGDWFAFDVGRIGKADGQAQYLSRLIAAVEEMYQDLEENRSRLKATDWHRIAIAAAACGADPASFGTDQEGNAIDLIRDGVWNCVLGDPGKQGINGYIWALLAADSRNYEEPADAEWTREDLKREILSRQQEDGGFPLTPGGSSDMDLTAMALTALAPYGETEETKKAFSWLSQMQREDGAMGGGGERTSESTSWALVALCSWGKDPRTEAEFLKEGHSLLDGLSLFIQEDGGVLHSLDDAGQPDASGMSAYQALYGLEACCRLQEGKNRIFDLTDAPEISQEEIDQAGEAIGEAEETQEKDLDEVKADTENRSVLLVGAISFAIVAVVLLLLLILFREKKKSRGKQGPEEDDEGDDAW